MQLKRVFPDSLTLEIDPEPQIVDKLWDISRQCARLWDLALEERRRQPESPGTREKTLQHLIAENPDLATPARSVYERVLWSLDEAFEQYRQAEEHFNAGRRGDMPAPPGPHPETVFFPLFFSKEFIRLDQPNCLELAYGDEWIPLQLPKGDYHKAEQVLIMYQPDRKHFEVELNPILVDIRD